MGVHTLPKPAAVTEHTEPVLSAFDFQLCGGSGVSSSSCKRSTSVRKSDGSLPGLSVASFCCLSRDIGDLPFAVILRPL